MSHDICPWWLGYLLVSPVRRWFQDPQKVLRPFVREGATVIEPGPGMGFFTLDIARMVGPRGRVVAVDIQPRMLAALTRRARRAGLSDRIETRLALADGMGLDDLEGKADLVLAFAVIHELPDAARFFQEAHRVLRPGGSVVVAEPAGHVSELEFGATLKHADRAGFARQPAPTLRRSRTALLQRPPETPISA